MEPTLLLVRAFGATVRKNLVVTYRPVLSKPLLLGFDLLDFFFEFLDLFKAFDFGLKRDLLDGLRLFQAIS